MDGSPTNRGKLLRERRKDKREEQRRQDRGEEGVEGRTTKRRDDDEKREKGPEATAKQHWAVGRYVRAYIRSARQLYITTDRHAASKDRGDKRDCPPVAQLSSSYPSSTSSSGAATVTAGGCSLSLSSVFPLTNKSVRRALAAVDSSDSNPNETMMKQTIDGQWK